MKQYTLPLFSENKIKVFLEPYIYGYIDQFLPDEIYRALDETFIGRTDHNHREVLDGGKQRFTF